MPIPKIRFLIGCVAAALSACEGRAAGGAPVDGDALVPALRAEPHVERRWIPRFSVPVVNAECATDAISDLRCHSSGPRRFIGDDVTRRIRARRSGPLSPDALQASALVDLLSGDTTRRTIERSIALLEMSVRLEPSASRLTDLAAAKLACFSQQCGARFVIEALDAASRAVELAPDDAAARYDRALALDILGLDDEAKREWRAYLRTDSASAHAAEARFRLNAIGALAPPVAPAADAPSSDFAAFARSAPAEAQQLAWLQLFRRWGESHERGDAAAARASLDRISAIARELERTGRDSSVVTALHALTRETSAHELGVIASAHVRYARAQGMATTNAYEASDVLYRELLATQPRSPALIARTQLARINVLIYARDLDQALPRAEQFVLAHDGRAEPLLHGRALWYVGTMRLRKGDYTRGLERMLEARGFFERAGDVESVGGTIATDAEVMFIVGDVGEGYAQSLRALQILRGRPGSLWRHNQLLTLSRATMRAELPAAASAIEAEDAIGASSGNRLVSVIEAKLARSRSLWRRGRSADAVRAAEEARQAIGGIADTTMRGQLYRDVNVMRASELLASRPDSAAALLSAALDFERRANFPGKVIPALVARAASYLALGRTQDAEADLSGAAARFESARDTMQRAGMQRFIANQARSVYDSLVMIRLRSQDMSGALRVVERSRVSFGNVGKARLRARTTRHENAIVDYALIGRELLTWTIVGHDTLFRRAVVDRDSLMLRIERVRGGLELGAKEADLRADLSRLYADLVKPIAGHIAGKSVRLVVDGALSQVPFAALWDEGNKRFLVQDHVLSFAPTLTDAQAAPVIRSPVTAVTFVANPATTGTRFRALPSLPGAEREATTAAALYSGARMLRGEDADSARVVRALGESELLHFAGHAILDDAQPWRSVLAVGPRGVSASAIASMKLDRARIVILSACETMRAPGGEAAGFAGLADAFLAAGVTGVVGSLWRVDDDDTARLMAEFHRAYRATNDAPAALRTAQTALIRAGRPPGAWAAFSYSGR